MPPAPSTIKWFFVVGILNLSSSISTPSRGAEACGDSGAFKRYVSGNIC